MSSIRPLLYATKMTVQEWMAKTQTVKTFMCFQRLSLKDQLLSISLST